MDTETKNYVTSARRLILNTPDERLSYSERIMKAELQDPSPWPRYTPANNQAAPKDPINAVLDTIVVNAPSTTEGVAELV